MNVTPGDSNATGGVSYEDRIASAVGVNLTVVVLGVAVNYINATMVHTFNKHHIFRLNPRYILFIHLVLNDIVQLTTSISLFIFAAAFGSIHVCACVLLIVPAILSTLNSPLNVAFMAAECYVAVCIPLRYNHICTVRRTYAVIGVIWTVSSLSLLPDVLLLLATEPLQFLNSRVFCVRDYVFRSPYSVRKRDASHILFLVLVWLTLFYTYFRILFAARAAKADATKARNTIVLHGFQVLLCMMVYVQPMLSQALTYVVSQTYFIMFLIIQLLPRFVSPIVYGLRDQTLRRYFIRYLLCTVTTKVQPQIKQNMQP